MKPFSSPSEDAGPDGEPPVASGGLFDGVLAAGPVAGEVGDHAWLRAMLDVEAALARAQARVGLIPADAAAEIVSACWAGALDADAAHRGGTFDAGRLGRAAADTGTPVLPLVQALRRAVSEYAAGYVHAGATSQDIMDSAAMLVARRALRPLGRDLAAAAEAAAGLAAAHRATPVAARTLLQHAVPTTFGLVAAAWLTALDEVADRLRQVAGHRLAVQLGGAAGTLAALEPHGLTVAGLLADDLGLAVAVLPWHTDRTRIADLATALGTVAGAVGKIARDITLYAQTEVAELTESAVSGASSAMPHKHNPVAAVAAVACATQAPGLVATLLAAMVQEQQRAAGTWHAEWRPLVALFTSVGSAVHWVRTSLESLIVHPDRMRANLDATGVLAAGPSGTAHPTPPERTADRRTPTGHTHAAAALTDRALRAHRRGSDL